MNNIDWEALKKAVQIEEPEEKKSDKTINVDIDYMVSDSLMIEYSPENDKYAQRKRLKAYFKAFQKMQYKTDDVKNLYDSVFEILRADSAHLGKMIMEDLAELDKCFNAEAYKATLILSGSILEAFLLDWLSEKDGKDYFQVPYKVKKVDDKGKEFWVKDESLSTYIEQIKELEMPNWMVPSEHAHEIRKKRNLVHAKLCLKEEVGVDKETCSMVIAYLKEIIDTRLKGIDDELL